VVDLGIAGEEEAQGTGAYDDDRTLIWGLRVVIGETWTCLVS
jgi:hypothetical protein